MPVKIGIVIGVASGEEGEGGARGTPNDF